MSEVPTSVGSTDARSPADFFLARALAVPTSVSSADASEVPTYVGSSDTNFAHCLCLSLVQCFQCVSEVLGSISEVLT